MSAWPSIPLGNVASSVMGQAPPGKDCNKDGNGTIFVKAGEFGERFPVTKEWTTNPLKMAQKGDVLVCVVGATAGKVNQAIDSAIGRSVAAVRPVASSLCTEYLYYFLCGKTLELREKSQGLAQGVITRDMLEVLQIPLPPLDEQKRIAAILDQADNLRLLRQRSLDRLNTLSQVIFYEMFGDPATNPRNWPMGTIEDLTASTQYGTSEKSGETGKYPVLRMGNITNDGKIDLGQLKYTNLPVKDVAKYTVKTGDILFNRTNSPDLVGKTAVFSETDSFAYAGYLVRLRVNEKGVPEYIGAFLNSPYGKKTLRNMCKAIVGMANINAQELRKIAIPLPDIETQNLFQKKLRSLAASLKPHQSSIENLNALFASLQHRAFRGEL